MIIGLCGGMRSTEGFVVKLCGLLLERNSEATASVAGASNNLGE